MGSLTQTEAPKATTKQNAKSTSTGTTAQTAQTAQDVTNTQSGNTTSTGTSTQVLTPEQQQLISYAMPFFQQYAANPPKAYEGQTVAGFTPTQETGQSQVLGGVPAQQGIAANSADASKFLLKDVLYPGSNPALQATIDSAVQPIYQKLVEDTLPAIRGGAVTSGQYGGSRQGIAEGLAARGASQAAGATAAGIANTGYQSGLEALTKGLALTPTTQQAQITPGLTTSAVGDVQQNLQQQLLDEAVNKYYYNQAAPFLTAEQLSGIASSLPGGTVQTTGQTTSTGTSNLSGLTNSTAAGASKTSGTNKGTSITTQTAPQTNPLLAGLGAAASILPIFFGPSKAATV